MSRYTKLFKEMMDKNEELFTEFEKVHEAYSKDESKNRKKFNQVGEEVTELMRVYVDELCRTSESSGYGNYTSKLADKFWQEARKIFPLIDDVGIEVE